MENVGSYGGEFDRELSAERDRWLRRRFLAYCAFTSLPSVAGLLAPLNTNWADPVDRRFALTLFTVHAFILVVLTGAVVYTRGRRGAGAWPVARLTTGMTIGIGVVNLLGNRVLLEIMSRGGPMPADAAWLAQSAGVLLWVLLIPCLFIPWTLGESLRAAAVLLAVKALIVSVDVASERMPPRGFAEVAIAAATAVPGCLVCWWRQSRFRERVGFDFYSRRYRMMESELAGARRLHETCLAQPRQAGPVRLSYAYEPMRQIGGDLLFVHPPSDARGAAEDGALNMVVLDVTGHGIAAAIVVNRIVGELERLFGERPDLSPREVLCALNRYVHVTLSRHQMYASALCIRADARRGRLEWASGGHPPALLRRGDGSVTPLESTAMLLGVVEGPEYVETAEAGECEFGAGDAVVAYTDGAAEAHGRDGSQLGTAGVRALLAAAADDGARDNGAAAAWPRVMLERVSAHRGGPPEDDTLIVAVYRPAEGQ